LVHEGFKQLPKYGLIGKEFFISAIVNVHPSPLSSCFEPSVKHQGNLRQMIRLFAHLLIGGFVAAITLRPILYLSGNDSHRRCFGRHYIGIDTVGSVICAAGQRMVED
jgi:hypothetical protein